MNPPLTDVEVRILGALAEKAVTTPDNYPLSLSALTAACNQTTNRDPVMQLDDETVTESIVTLRRRSFLRAIQPAGSRVTKYQHLLAEALEVDARELALLGVLMLRGAQTPGELHARTARLAEFTDTAEMEATLDALVSRDPLPLVTRLPKRAGQKEVRYAHLLGGPVVTSDDVDAPSVDSPSSPPASSVGARVEALQQAVDELRGEVAELRAQFLSFREEFR
ncbi:MAG: YceH family protein [Gemmatimonadota bacterium]